MDQFIAEDKAEASNKNWTAKDEFALVNGLIDSGKIKWIGTENPTAEPIDEQVFDFDKEKKNLTDQIDNYRDFGVTKEKAEAAAILQFGATDYAHLMSPKGKPIAAVRVDLKPSVSLQAFELIKEREAARKKFRGVLGDEDYVRGCGTPPKKPRWVWAKPKFSIPRSLS